MWSSTWRACRRRAELAQPAVGGFALLIAVLAIGYASAARSPGRWRLRPGARRRRRGQDVRISHTERRLRDLFDAYNELAESIEASGSAPAVAVPISMEATRIGPAPDFDRSRPAERRCTCSGSSTTDPAQPIAAHMLREGVTSVGRDPAADWSISDPECEISRHHLELISRMDARCVRCERTGCSGAKPTSVSPIARISARARRCNCLRQIRMVVDSVPFDTRAGASSTAQWCSRRPWGQPAIPDCVDGVEAPPPAGGLAARGVLRGRQAGRLRFVRQEPEEVMRRAGAIIVRGARRASSWSNEPARAALSMDRTTIGAQDNNPFKWSPTRRLATNLLMGREAGSCRPGGDRASFRICAPYARHCGRLRRGSATLLELLAPPDRGPYASKKGLLQGAARPAGMNMPRFTPTDRRPQRERAAPARAFAEGYEAGCGRLRPPPPERNRPAAMCGAEAARLAAATN